MSKKLLLLAFILLLIAVSWFRPAFCGKTVRDSLPRQYSQKENLNQNITNPDQTYISPDIFGETPPMAAPGTSNDSISPAPGESARKATALEPFGYGLFRAPSELTPPSEVADASEYLLGPGDNIIIYLWGKVEREYDLMVDRHGKVFIPKIGETTVWGLSVAEFTVRIKEKLSQVYSGFKMSVSLGKIRSIRVYLTGEIKRPGAYTVSSLTTLFNALYLAGGPNIRGSMRDIRLIRNNRIE
ncbi:MAG: polysaccharide biosynthesis/export family protein, partial [Candidatus Zixiibacteriota bacterium]